jgi:hypothetical protein
MENTISQDPTQIFVKTEIAKLRNLSRSDRDGIAYFIELYDVDPSADVQRRITFLLATKCNSPHVDLIADEYSVTDKKQRERIRNMNRSVEQFIDDLYEPVLQVIWDKNMLRSERFADMFRSEED